ncbi:MAG: right-handed parallel beta-helix repeat-containing protein [Sphingomonadaceae bacterium]|nr:right-handed parallel beta-helix repeat-containing protein [Sphingomonadaceae bacterium]
MRHLLLALALFALPVSARTIDVAAGPNAQERLQTALIDAKPGDVVRLGSGRFALTDGLSLDVDRVTIRGAGLGATVLDFKGQKASGEGLLVTSDDVVLTGFAVEDARGDAIKSKGADRIVYHDLRVEWTGGPKPTNGAYGVYPVASQDVLIDHVTVRGASDAGIYVGQSRHIIVRNSTAEYNVAGIEIENSFEADVHDNLSTHNAGGILVFDLPNLPQTGGNTIRVFNNRVVANDTPNFAPKGNIVASVPNGTGVMVMANRDVHVFGNTLGDNATVNVMVVAYKRPFTDPRYDPLPHDVVVRDNIHGRAGWAPGFVGGKELAAAMGGSLTPIFWDGAGGRARTNIQVREKVGVVSLGLAEALTPVEQAKPAPVDLSGGPAIVEPKAVVLPASMEAAIK